MTVPQARPPRPPGKPDGTAALTAPAAQPIQGSLQPQDLVLDLMGWYLRPAGGQAWSGGLVRLLGDLGFSTAAARIALGRLVRRGLLARAKDGRLVYYRPTARLDSLLAEGERRIRSFGLEEPWDDRWTVLWYAIPEEHKVEGRRLARRLRFLGFGSPQEGMWLAPRDREADVRSLVDDLGLSEYVAVVVGRTAASTDGGSLARRVWDLRDLAKRYEAFLAALSPFCEQATADSLPDREAFLIRTRAVAAYRGFPPLDPSLPEELVGRAWKRREVVETFHRIDEVLRPASTRYFDAANTPQRRPARVSA